MEKNYLNLSQIKEQVEEFEGTKFPVKSYSRIELEPAYNEAKKNLLDYMMLVNKAHLIMLKEQEIVEDKDAGKIMKGILEVDKDKFRNNEYTGEFEDLYFEVEDQIIKNTGDIGGNIHIARSRNDMGVALYRLAIRDRLLSLYKSACELQKVIIEFSEEHKETIMIAHTHTQQAQPTYLGHYTIGFQWVLNRDIIRLKSAFNTCNRSTLGAAAITTSGFNVNRDRMRELLGFNDVIENSYDCIGGGDYLGEVATSIQLAAINLGRFVSDLLLWATQEFNILKVSKGYVQISSIMPQKRNPVSIEHIRALLSSVIGNCSTILTMLHNTPYGDIVDTEDDAQPYIWKAMDTMKDIYNLLYSIMATLEINKEVLKDRAEKSFAMVTELADTLLREYKIPFRLAHSIVSASVDKCMKEGLLPKDIDRKMLETLYEEKCGRKIKFHEEIIKKALDPYNFVNIRSVEGGPAPKSMKDMISKGRKANVSNINWHDEKFAYISNSINSIENLSKEMVREYER
ncbi:argininosuccinate lyase [Clostridium sp. MSJ-11]|uniref:Argininosuccinate lyase n=1 Tax=Clostridium mobile TaxID=2841512 RepID=A0ABS6EF76_9CLOT|nr:argininosuccinate lyase [Clostridium mobile]MBU5483371.1 argininosuccinate lyase [Clostridium mobile]